MKPRNAKSKYPVGKVDICFAIILMLFQNYCVADDQYFDLIASGRFDQVVAYYQPVDEQGRIDTSELHALCLAYAKLKNYEKIFSCVEKLLARGMGAQKSSRLFGTLDVTPVAQLFEAEANLELGRYGRAARAGEAVVKWYRDVGRRDNEVLVDAVAVLSLCANRLDLKADAERYLRLLERIPVDTHFSLRKAQALARVSLTLGLPQKARSALEGNAGAIKASLRRIAGKGAGQGTSNWLWDELPRAYLYAKAVLQTGARAEAGEMLNDLLRTPEVYFNGEIYWLAHFDLATIASSENRPAEAINHLMEAIRTIERQRSTIRSEANKIGFIADRHEVYGRLVELLIGEGRFAEASEVIDRASSRALVDVLAERVMQAQLPLAEADQAALKQVALQHGRDSLQNPRVIGDSQKAVLFANARESDSLEGVSGLSSDVRSMLSVKPQTLGDLRLVLRDGELAIQYFVYGGSLVIVWFDRNEVHGTRLPAGDLYALVKAMRNGLASRRRVDEASQRLYDLLLKPVVGLSGAKRVVVVPSGPLYYLPFAALTDSKRDFVDGFSILTLPSLSVLQLLRAAPSLERRSAVGILAFGNPDLGSPDMDLPSAQEEVEALAQSAGADILVRQQASQPELLKRQAAYRVLHFATHGEYDAEVPLKSALRLAVTAGNDGELRAEDILSLRINADLVTMSACETGLGLNLRGDEMIGLNRAWFFAGARNIVASLWKVDDRTTARLMALFYRNLEKMDIESALRLAQIEIKKSNPSPFFWGAFYVSGGGGFVRFR